MNGYIQEDRGNTRRFVQTLELKDDPQMIAEYRRWHSREYHWREIREEIRSVGILEMEIYIFNTTLVMIVDTPLDFDWEKAMARLSSMPRQAEWEALVARLQGCCPEARSDEKWQMMERMFMLYD
ncbi:MAG: L-rhamnose mutarotase [Bacteroidaceae bacterium]|nr:L-rhamnose mutarotase [Bacteroidaceae bacterium]